MVGPNSGKAARAVKRRGPRAPRRTHMICPVPGYSTARCMAIEMRPNLQVQTAQSHAGGPAAPASQNGSDCKSWGILNRIPQLTTSQWMWSVVAERFCNLSQPTCPPQEGRTSVRCSGKQQTLNLGSRRIAALRYKPETQFIRGQAGA